MKGAPMLVGAPFALFLFVGLSACTARTPFEGAGTGNDDQGDSYVPGDAPAATDEDAIDRCSGGICVPANLAQEPSLVGWWHMGTGVTESAADQSVVEVASIFTDGWRLVVGDTHDGPAAPADEDWVTFTGAQELFVSLPEPIRSPTTLLVVFRFTESQTWKEVIGGYSTAPSFPAWNRNLFTDDSFILGVDNRDDNHASKVSGGTWSAGVWKLAVVTESPDHATLSIDGTLVDESYGPWVLHDLLELHVGCTGRSDNCFIGQIGELVLFTSDLSGDSRLDELAAELGTRWGIF